jgi:tetracycline 7-halogenase / FADH2 O2-dependent halogenase
VEETQFDVCIVGAGVAGSILAAILARHQLRVGLIDAGTHPRFAVGESTVPHTSKYLRLMALRYDVPELEHIASFEAVAKNVARSCGKKRGLGFVHHVRGLAHDPQHVTQSVIPNAPEIHWFRQDVDAYVFNVAVRYGAAPLLSTNVNDVQPGPDGVVLSTSRGPLRCKYLVDASGSRSPLADRYGLREQPTRMRTQSRGLFTHMVGVPPFEKVTGPVHGMPVPWSECTLHHIFDGGWIWVIPFDNHAGSTNLACSVGACLDPRKYPASGQAPEAEFRSLIEQFPDVARQLRDAKTVRPWVGTPERLQYSSTSTVGERYCLTAHAAGFIDALFSRGLASTMQVLDALAGRLLDAVAADDFGSERFEYIDRLQRSLLDNNDTLVDCAFTSFRDFDLWNAWFRIWALATGLGALRMTAVNSELKAGRQPRLPDQVLDDPDPGFFGVHHEHADMRRLWRDAAALVRSVETGERGPKDAARAVLALIDTMDFVPPPLHLGDAERRFVDFDRVTSLKVLWWGWRKAPPGLRQMYASRSELQRLALEV